MDFPTIEFRPGDLLIGGTNGDPPASELAGSLILGGTNAAPSPGGSPGGFYLGGPVVAE